ncbi:hypothetical protein R3W88_025026 [Solanum pinnatisectum]|uniref:Uncharacterized protein n=1 Tax=Solanum pinnatisectum TaxID=50273 RepID=A0AAV9M1V7_9SOLN|nr:hypothetical protein R3W88_025026 [Solanum pinnatisectum]
MIRRGGLTKAKTQDIGEKEMVITAWGDSGDTYSMWVRTPDCIREASKEIKVESNNVAYLMLVKILYEDNKMRNKDMYEKTKKKANLAITMAKIIIFEHLYEELECKGGCKKLYRLIKVRERRSCDMDQGKQAGMKWLTRLLNVIFRIVRLSEEWRWSIIVLLYKNKRDI